MALEDKNKVPLISNSSCDDYCDDDDDDDNDNDDDDDESLITSKLMHKYTSLLSRKQFYKYKFTSLTKEFKNLKIEFSNLIKSNDKIINDLENSNSLEDQLKKANDENHNFLRRS